MAGFMPKRGVWVLVCMGIVAALSGVSARAETGVIGFFVNASDAYVCDLALHRLGPFEAEVKIFTEEEMGNDAMQAFIRRMDVGVVDIMPRQPAQWVMDNLSQIKPGARIFAVRRSSHTQDFLDAGFLPDPSVQAYFSFTSEKNIANLIRFLARRELGGTEAAPPPDVPLPNALYHPDAPALFPDMPAYLAWYRESGRYDAGKLWNLSVVFPTFCLDGKREPLDALIRSYEANGINTVTWLRHMTDWDKTMAELIAAPPLRGRLGSITGLTFKFSSTLSSDVLSVLKQADVPIFNPQYLFFSTGEQWSESPRGISPAGLPMQFGIPELSALIEPGVIGVKERVSSRTPSVNTQRFVPIFPQIEKMARRAARWHDLKQKANGDKKVVLVYYNHGGGKQNIGASYLNVFRSIEEIVRALGREGYAVDDGLEEKTIKDLLLKSGRNVGAWAPGERDRMIAEGHVIRIARADYEKWFAELDPIFQQAVVADWGPARDAKIMTWEDDFIIPCIRLGNLFLAPQPSRGWCDDPEKLYHSTTLMPHHQYVAFYLWLRKRLQPDAMISLGTHGTHEWLPGKQAGLSAACAPEVLIGDIPNLYPYIVDDVGEGIQAKRRGRGVVIDHAVPPFKAGGAYGEYSKLAALISEYDAAPSEKIRGEKRARIVAKQAALGLDVDMGGGGPGGDDIERLAHYLLALKTEMVPYGLHTFGVSPAGEARQATAAAMAGRGKRSAAHYENLLDACGPAEMDSLMRGLRGGYVPPGAGNDPLRNPESLPTGRNFYGFDPDRVPSREAWENGKEAANALIAAYRGRHDGAFPAQVGLVLWSVETIRDEGINVATALHLMGMQPRWDFRDKVTGVVPIAGGDLKRPRIDVLLQMSGLFRDTFPQVALMLDKAVIQAAGMDDVENYLRRHAEAITERLMAQGCGSEEARRMSLVRIFSAKPGAYGTKVDDMAGASGLWEGDDTVAEQGFVNMVSYGYSAEMWGQPLKETYRENLKKVEVTVHTISSNLYATMDNDDMFQYLGGLSMAVRKASGKNPDVYVSLQKTSGQGQIEPIAATVGRELRSRYLNPAWIEGMKKENYAGAREMAAFLENMWGWQVTTPETIDKTKWEQTYAVYVEDKYGMDLKDFFNRENPWAYQSMTGRMLEAVRKNYWHADEKITRNLAAEYALNVVAKGVACCDHTCNNPMLNQMVLNIISLPGVLSPEIVERFKLAVEKAAAASLDEQVAQRKNFIASKQAGLGQKEVGREKSIRKDPKKTNGQATAKQVANATVEGFKMEAANAPDDTTDLSASGVQWAASLFVLLLMGLFFWGTRHRGGR